MEKKGYGHLFKGVQKLFSSTGIQYRAYITFQKEFNELGYYNTAEEAARAYDEAAKRFYGDKVGRLNFPTPVTPPDGAAVIYLTRGYHSLVDIEDYERFSKYRWSVHFHKSKPYAINRGNQLHRMVLDLGSNDTKIEVDHINHDSLDNRKQNLRKCTRQENSRNTRSRVGSKSKYKGVSWDKNRKGNKWISYITLDDENKFLGNWEIEEHAALIYNLVAKHYFKDFVYLNNISLDEETTKKITNIANEYIHSIDQKREEWAKVKNSHKVDDEVLTLVWDKLVKAEVKEINLLSLKLERLNKVINISRDKIIFPDEMCCIVGTLNKGGYSFRIEKEKYKEYHKPAKENKGFVIYEDKNGNFDLYKTTYQVRNLQTKK